MITDLINQLGPWNWIVLGLVLMVLEILLPGVFLLWIGIAALLVGAMSLQLWGFGPWSWEIQVLVFLALAVISALVGRQIMARTAGDSDQPLLNRRREQLIGQTAVLAEPIAEGRGRIRLGDTYWRVSGPDLPAGARVRIKAVENAELIVEAA